MSVTGQRELRRRLLAVSAVPEVMLKRWQTRTVQLARKAAPVKTANLAKNIQMGALSKNDATVRANVGYARYLEFGTGLYGPSGKAYPIRPRRKKALAWATTASGRRLSGLTRNVTKRGQMFPVTGRVAGGATPRNLRIRPVRGQGVGPAEGPVTVRRGVIHPGIRPRPFLIPSAKQALEEAGVEPIVNVWNGAA